MTPTRHRTPSRAAIVGLTLALVGATGGIVAAVLGVFRLLGKL